MSKHKKNKKSRIADDILSGMDEIIRFLKGEKNTGVRVSVVKVPKIEDLDVASIRRSLGMSVEKFAKTHKLTVSKVKELEKKTSKPVRRTSKSSAAGTNYIQA